MSGVESLVTQVKQGEEQTFGRTADFTPPPEESVPSNHHTIYVSEQDEKESEPSFWQRLFCCRSKTVANTPTTTTTQPVTTTKAEVSVTSKQGTYVNLNDDRIPGQKYLLPERPASELHKKTLVLDLDETLLHSSFKPIDKYDFTVDILIKDQNNRIYVMKRPGVDEFLRHVAKKWEVVIFTASLASYADLLLDYLDTDKCISHRLYRPSCVLHYKHHVKDLTMLGRCLRNCPILDNSYISYLFQPTHAIPVTTWYNDPEDTELYDLLPYLDALADCDDVAIALANSAHLFPQTGIIKQPYTIPALNLEEINKQSNAAYVASRCNYFAKNGFEQHNAAYTAAFLAQNNEGESIYVQPPTPLFAHQKSLSTPPSQSQIPIPENTVDEDQSCTKIGQDGRSSMNSPMAKSTNNLKKETTTKKKK